MLPLIILAAGLGSRMRQSNPSHNGIKGMMTIRNVPLLEYQLYLARQADIGDILLVVGEENSVFRNWYGSKDRGNDYYGLSISYAIQRIPEGRTKPLGTADAVLQTLGSRTEWNESVIVCNSDNLYSSEALKGLCHLQNSGGWIDYDVDGLEFDDEHLGQFGVTETDANGYLTAIIEKPGIEELQQRRKTGPVAVTMNIWKLPVPLVIPYLETCPIHSVRNEKELPTAITNMVKDHPRSMKSVPLKEHVPDLTRMSDFKAMEQFVSNHFPESLWS